MMRFSDRLQEYVTGRDDTEDFLVGEWLTTLSGSDFTLLFERIERVMYLDEDEVSDDEVQDVLHVAVWAYQHETQTPALLDPDDVERLALDLELAVWLETARRKGLLSVEGGISIVDAGEAHVLLTADGVSHAVARAWSTCGASPETCLH